VVRWPDGERIRLVLRPAADADTLYLRGLSPALAEAMEAALARPGMLMAVTNQECDAMLARTPGSLGPSTLAQLATEAPGLTPLAWEGVPPTLEALASGRYPLSKPLVLLLPARPAPAALRFLDFVRSPEGRRILSAAGCLPTGPPAGG
jgi:phosphate transport system substrate-binding protein